MTIDWTKRQRRKDDIKGRAAAPDWEVGSCKVVGCGNPARAATGEGLDRRFCRSHADHYSRHGSPYKKSYTASELREHRVAARRWLEQHIDEASVQIAVLRVKGLFQQAGHHVEAFRLRGLSPEDRARAAWARLRKAKVEPLEIIAAWMAIEAMVAADPQPELKNEFKHVQAARLIHRMASGTHKSWPKPGGGVQELHVYPRPRGRVLRHIGAQMEEAAGDVHSSRSF